MRVYISGPMSGLPEHNFPAFNAVAEALRCEGVDVVNPVEVNPDCSTSWGECLRRDLREMLTCDLVVVLPGWERSKGANLEKDTAEAVGIPSVDLAFFLRGQGYSQDRAATFARDVSPRWPEEPSNPRGWSLAEAAAPKVIESPDPARPGPVCAKHFPVHHCDCPVCQDTLSRRVEIQQEAKNAAGTKPTNPKDAIGSSKLPMHLWPETASALGALALLDGALKYGRSNFRAIGVRASIYVDALRRHVGAWFEGEDADPDSGLPHLAHALACLAILVDSQAAGKLNDDRMVRGGYRAFLNELTAHVPRLKALHAEKDPKHWTIQDNADVPQS